MYSLCFIFRCSQSILEDLTSIRMFLSLWFQVCYSGEVSSILNWPVSHKGKLDNAIKWEGITLEWGVKHHWHRLKSMKQRNPGQGRFDALETVPKDGAQSILPQFTFENSLSRQGFLEMLFQMACHYALILIQQHIWVWDKCVLLNSLTCR